MFAEALTRYLGTRGHCTTGIDGFWGLQQDQPDHQVCCFDESAPQDGDASIVGIDVAGVQVLVRSRTYAAARDLAWAIHRDIVGFAGVLWAGFPHVAAIAIVTAPSFADRDQNRPVFSAHYALTFASAGDQFRL